MEKFMSITLFGKLRKELELAKKENPVLDDALEGEDASKLLEKIIAADDIFGHGSHNSHGDWGKHWAHGGYEDDEPTDDSQANPPRP